MRVEVFGVDNVKTYTFKSYIFLVAAFLGLLLCAGCSRSEEDRNETTVIIDNKGGITHRIVESFDKDYYSEDELRDDINRELEDYCRGKDEKSAKLNSLEIREGVATAEIKFAGYEDYAAFNDVDLFYGTIREAMAKEYPTDVTLKGRGDDEETIGKYEFESMGDSMLVVVSEPVVVELPKKIAYTTANMDIIDDDKARMASDSVGLGYIVLK